MLISRRIRCGIFTGSGTPYSKDEDSDHKPQYRCLKTMPGERGKHQGEKLREPMCAKHKPTYYVRTVAILGVCSDCTGVQGGRASQGLVLFLFLELGARNMVRP